MKYECSDEQFELLVSRLGTAAALFMIEYNKAIKDGTYLQYGVDSILRKILLEYFEK